MENSCDCELGELVKTALEMDEYSRDIDVFTATAYVL